MPKVLALDSIASRLCDDFDNAIGTAQQLIELHRGQVRGGMDVDGGFDRPML